MEREFKLDSDHIELIKLLKVTGLCQTGGEAKQSVAEGQVRVDGQVELRKKCKIRKGQVVSFRGAIVRLE